ncbi:MAG: signal peptidase I [Erysipelotrichaceae bacterium]|nr:signal peptidase I [Erysipelotrichaceae bacterium]MDY5252693.1 signal peptidase I [Erysipelotrichaceae bacterium]
MSKNTFKDVVLDFLKTLAISLVIVYVLTRVLIRPISVNGNSMYPTLKDKDFGIASVYKTFINDVKRDDIVIIHLESGEYIIKRVIGLPNETVSCENGVVMIDGEPLDQTYLDQEYVSTFDVFTEDFAPVTLGSDEFFVMGDNRPNSKDSRYYGAFKYDDIKGVVDVMLWPFKVMD